MTPPQRSWNPFKKPEPPKPVPQRVEDLDPEVLAKAIKMFSDGKHFPDVQTELRLPKPVVKAIFEQYVEAQNEEKEISKRKGKPGTTGAQVGGDNGPPYHVYKNGIDLKTNRRTKRLWHPDPFQTQPATEADLREWPMSVGNGECVVLDCMSTPVGRIIIASQDPEFTDPVDLLTPEQRAVQMDVGRSPGADPTATRQLAAVEKTKAKLEALADAALAQGNVNLSTQLRMQAQQVEAQLLGVGMATPWNPQPFQGAVPYGTPPGTYPYPYNQQQYPQYGQYPGQQQPGYPPQAQGPGGATDPLGQLEYLGKIFAAGDKIRFPNGVPTGQTETDPEVAKYKAYSEIAMQAVDKGVDKILNPLMERWDSDKDANEELERDGISLDGDGKLAGAGGEVDWEGIINIDAPKKKGEAPRVGPVRTRMRDAEPPDDDFEDDEGGDTEAGGVGEVDPEDDQESDELEEPAPAPEQRNRPTGGNQVPTETGIMAEMEMKFILRKHFPKLALAIMRNRTGKPGYTPEAIGARDWRQMRANRLFLGKGRILRAIDAAKKGPEGLIAEWQPKAGKEGEQWEPWSKIWSKAGPDEALRQAKAYAKQNNVEVDGDFLKELKRYRRLKRCIAEFTTPDGMIWLRAYMAAFVLSARGGKPQAAPAQQTAGPAEEDDGIDWPDDEQAPPAQVSAEIPADAPRQLQMIAEQKIREARARAAGAVAAQAAAPAAAAPQPTMPAGAPTPGEGEVWCGACGGLIPPMLTNCTACGAASPRAAAKAGTAPKVPPPPPAGAPASASAEVRKAVAPVEAKPGETEIWCGNCGMQIGPGEIACPGCGAGVTPAGPTAPSA